MTPKERSLSEILRELEETRFFGSLEIKFESGRPILFKKTQTIKPGYRNNRGEINEPIR